MTEQHNLCKNGSEAGDTGPNHSDTGCVGLSQREPVEKDKPGPARSEKGRMTRARSGSVSSSSSVRSGTSRERDAERMCKTQLALQANRYALLAHQNRSRVSSEYEYDSSEISDEEERIEKSKANLKRKRTTKREVIVVEDEEESEGTCEKKGKRGPGRPPTTGEYVGLATAKGELIARLREEEEIAAERRIRSWSSKKLFTSMKLDLDEAVEEMRKTPSEDVANRAHKCMESVLQVAKVSRNLQGTKVKELKQASVVGAAAIEVLRSRSDGEPDNDIARQVRFLRKELEKAREEARLAREETQRLKKELDVEREVRKGERGRRRKISDSPSPPGQRASRDEKGETHQGAPETDDLEVPGSSSTSTSTAEEPMEVEMAPQKRKEDEKIILPPMEEWPQAIRPAIQGKIRVLEDLPLKGHKI